jgi:chaperonin cofactor prefoldin
MEKKGKTGHLQKSTEDVNLQKRIQELEEQKKSLEAQLAETEKTSMEIASTLSDYYTGLLY